MKTMPAASSRLRKGFAFRQETVAGMHRLGAGLAAGLDDFVDHEVAFRGGRRPDQDGVIGHFHVERVAVGFGIDGNGFGSPSGGQS